ncbi:MAG: thioredoxin domain-containing protein [Bryobacteraceae bacterium]
MRAVFFRLPRTRLMALVALLPLGVFAQEPLVEGNKASAVRVVIFEDLQCPDCAVFREMLDRQLLPKYKSKVAFEHRDFPLAKHAWARRASIASQYFAAQKPETAIEFRRWIMRNQQLITAENFNQKLGEFAAKHAMDPGKAIAALEDDTLQAAVEKAFQDGVARGIAKTPTVLVNGEPFIETFAAADVMKAIDRELKANP